jgi:hypothetical protein
MTKSHHEFGPAWFGWEDYRHFAQAAKEHERYVRGDKLNQFLEEVRGSCHTRALPIEHGKTFWRAQIGCDMKAEVISEEDGLTAVVDQYVPFSAERMKPIRNWHTEGRANPRGITYLYLATDRDTARSEVRPWMGSRISLAQFKITADLRVIDCSRFHKNTDLIRVLNPELPREEGIWSAIDRAFASPVTRLDEDEGEYIPTQIIAELIKVEGYDGIAYKSLLAADGYNVALFNPDKAEVVPRSLCLSTVDAVTYQFTDEPD